MNKISRYTIYFLLTVSCIHTALGIERSTEADFSLVTDELQEDSIKPRYSVRKTSPETLEDMVDAPLDFKNPENIKTEVTYDEKNNQYIIGTKAGDEYIDVPLYLTPEEYSEWSLKRSLEAYYRSKNGELFTKEADKFSFSDLKFDIGPAEKIFGPGGVQIKTQGSAELKFGVKYNFIDNPTLSVRSRKSIGFDFDEKINISVNGKVGDKVNLNMNYNTDATFDFDSKKIKLKYEGKEDEIIKLLEAGNVSMPTNSSLIRGATSLFGIRADLQFGKLMLQTVVSQQESESKTVSSKGGAQTTEFEVNIDDYDENRHFFLAHFFREAFDKNMSELPNSISGINITNIEVWVTNKRGNYDNPRNIVAFGDLGEKFNNNKAEVPDNETNTLLVDLNNIPGLRDINKTNNLLAGLPLLGKIFEGGRDYEKIENARLLTSSEYTLNKDLGYISLRQALQPDEVMGVAFDFTYRGVTYKVGEFATDVESTTSSVYVKLLKSTSNSPSAITWKLMMRNVYSLNAYQVQEDRFKLNILYQSDTTGVYLNYIPEEKVKQTSLLRLMNLDRLNTKKQPIKNGDGFFDFVEGYTIQSQNGRVIFPVVEPFGEHLRNVLGDSVIASKYVFQELYDTTKTAAKQIAEKNKFKLKGEYRASSGSEIRLGSMNIPAGSVKVTAGGMTLTENQDYTVDYTMGVVTIINQSIVDAGTSISVNLESNTNFSMQRKTMVGMNFMYDFTPDFQLGGTIMHLNEKPMTNKVAMGDEPISNTLWGLNTAWKKQSQWLTNMIDKIPFINATQPSNISFTAEFAHLIPGHAKGIQDDASYIDDFESTKIGIDVRYPYDWVLSSTPRQIDNWNATNELRYGNDRALLNWFYIDPLFTRRSSSLTPSHIKNDMDQLSNHYVREVYQQELFPNKESTIGQASTLSILNLAYYPDERGPYNLDTNLTPEGKLEDPSKRWAGMMRKLNTTDFEAANIEYIEFWMLDPFIYDPDHKGGEFYINLGEISEDILKDGKKFFENGIPVDGDTTKVEKTVWGYVPKDRSIVYAFDNAEGGREAQDTGLNGLTSEQEREYPTYKAYLDTLSRKLNADVYERFYEDPAGDTYHYYRGSDYDYEELSILERYKRYNNTEGNSSGDNNSNYSSSYKSTPDIEDINGDYTLNEYEKYFSYKINLKPGEMQVGKNYIINERTTSVRLRNGNTEEVNWYQFKIPIKTPDKETIGEISDFSSIRFMRLFLKDFEESIVLRFATMDLVRGEWRTYEQALNSDENSTGLSGSLEVSAVNIEENGDKEPVNYVIPPGISRVIDPSQPQLRQQNEQAMSLVVKGLENGDAKAVYKNTSLDLRQYNRLQMFVHGEKLIDDNTNLEDGQMTVFIRLGSDYKNNYYEYEIPLKLTPHNRYDQYSTTDRRVVWPEENMVNINLKTLTDIKKKRNSEKNTSGSGVSFVEVYSQDDPEKPNNRISIMGNPSLSEVKTIMIGVRNKSRHTKSVEVWVNELRLTDFNEEGGWAAQSNLNLQLSDLGVVNLGGHIETAGFGGLEESVSERRLDDYYQYNITTSFELGKFFPEKAKVNIPIYFSYSKEITSPKYNPLDQDILLKDALKILNTKEEKDSLKNIAREITTYKNFSISNARIGIVSKTPMPYDPANFTFGYSFTRKHNQGSTTEWEKDNMWQANFGYAYTPALRPWEPFKKMKTKSKWAKIVKELNFSFLPQMIGFNTDLYRRYYELQIRDLDSNYGDLAIPLSYSQEYLWNRDFALRWDVTKALKLNFTSGTQAEIEEEDVPVNKNLYPDEYTIWKESVKASLRSLGRPLEYKQTFNASYQLPINKLPIFDWITSDAKYSSYYTWDRGSKLSNGESLGNTIFSQRSIDMNGRLNLETLYNKVPFLKETNRKFASNARTTSRSQNQRQTKPKKFEQEIQLKPDTTVTLSHNVNSKKPRVTALKQDGTRYILKYKVVDANKIMISNLDTIKVKVNVLPGPKPEDQKWYQVSQYAARFGMMIRNASISYRNTYAMSVPGFTEEIGDILGQRKSNGIWAPGLDFAFGLQGKDYLRKAYENDWLYKNDTLQTDAVLNNDLATTNAMEDLQLRMTLEPFRDFKIDLNASHTRNKSQSIQHLYSNMSSTRNGSLNMTIISIKSSFGGTNAKKGYESKTFNQFVKNLDVIQARITNQYQPFINDNPAFKKEISKYSADVMIPSFLAAYTGKNAGKTALDFFPQILSMMPNWKITYSGLSKLNAFKKHFKSFNLNHSYRSIYSIGSYTTYQDFIAFDGELGHRKDMESGLQVASSIYNINSVSINEQYAPLIGVDMTFHNNITAKVEYKKTRIVNLSMAASQITESFSNDFVIGAGYKLINVNLFGGSKNNQKDAISNDLDIRADFSWRNQSALNRNIQEVYTQATSGNRAIKMSFSADYAFSRLMTLRLYYDRQKNTPLVSSTCYPTVSADFGFSVRISLTR